MSGLQLHKKENLLAAYQDLRPTLDALCFAVDGVLRRIIPARYVVATSHRLKRFDSFYEKANKLRGEELKYHQPVQEITDLVGFRIIVIAKRNVEQACEIIRNSFKILDEENKADKLLEEGKLGYESHHLIVQLGDARKALSEYEGLCDTSFEVQIRTALQHAWAENEHRVQYKASKKNPELQKRFLRLAGVVSSADEEFDRIYEINERISESVASGIGQLPEESPNIEAAEGDQKRGKNLGPQLREAATMFGVGPLDLTRQRRYSEAIQVYDRLISLQPTQASHYAGRARAKALDGDVDGALDDLTRSDELEPDNAALKNVLRILDSIIPRETEG